MVKLKRTVSPPPKPREPHPSANSNIARLETPDIEGFKGLQDGLDTKAGRFWKWRNQI